MKMQEIVKRCVKRREKSGENDRQTGSDVR